MAEIVIGSRRTKYSAPVLFDDDDWPLLFNIRWHICKRNARTFYCAGRITSGRLVYMHQLILSAPAGLVIDHVNLNGLDNRRSNLRLATIANNLRNSPPKSGKRFKGISYRHGLSKPWSASIHTKSGPGGKIHLGYFKTDVEAAIAYNKAAQKHFGKLAWLNPVEQYQSSLKTGLINGQKED